LKSREYLRKKKEEHMLSHYALTRTFDLVVRWQIY
jgi:hypothetical protein